MEADALAHGLETPDCRGTLIIDPNNPLRRKKIHAEACEELLMDVVAKGEIIYRFPSLEEIRARRKDQLVHLHESYRRLHNPHEYKVGLTFALWQQKEQMLNQETV